MHLAMIQRKEYKGVLFDLQFDLFLFLFFQMKIPEKEPILIREFSSRSSFRCGSDNIGLFLNTKLKSIDCHFEMILTAEKKTFYQI
jgi:hypothetical protein